jgi:hypothetical protein
VGHSGVDAAGMVYDARRGRGRSGRRSRQYTHLLQESRLIDDCPVLDDLAVPDTMNRDALGFDFTVGCRDAEDLAVMDTAPTDEAYDKISLGDLQFDHVVADVPVLGRGDTGIPRMNSRDQRVKPRYLPGPSLCSQ